MSEVKRYHFGFKCVSGRDGYGNYMVPKEINVSAFMLEHDDGEYVKFEDYARLAERVEVLEGDVSNLECDVEFWKEKAGKL